MDRVRVQRLIIYEGPRDWVEDTVTKSITGHKVFGTPFSPKSIFGVTLSAFPEVIPESPPPLKHDLQEYVQGQMAQLQSNTPEWHWWRSFSVGMEACDTNTQVSAQWLQSLFKMAMEAK